MLIYRPLQTKGFIKEFTDTLLTMAMKYPDLSSWEISTHTSTRLQIWSPTNSPPGFPPKHSLGISTLTFTVSLKGSLLLALSGMCHPDRKFQWAACLLKFPTCGQYQQEVRSQDHRVWLCWIPLPNACKHAEERMIGWGRRWKMELSSSRFPGFCYIWGSQSGCLFGTSIMMTLRSLLAVSVDHLLSFNPCALWFDLYWTRRVWTSHKGCLEPGVSETFGPHMWARAD